MFWKRRSLIQKPVTARFTRPTWDEKTVKKITESNRFEVHIIECERFINIGFHNEEQLLPPRPEGYEIHGVLTYPKYIIVTISFAPSDNVGIWFYNRRDKEKYQGNEYNIPMLEMCLTNTDGITAKTIHDGHRDAIICGRNYSLVRIWKRKGDGLMTETDKEHDFSYESRYPIIGLTMWSHLVSRSAPGWAYMPGDERFTLESSPEWYDLDRELG